MCAMISKLRATLAGILGVGAFVLGITAFATGQPPLITTEGGLQFREMVEGKGHPVEVGDLARIHVVMYLKENDSRGAELYNSRAEREAVPFIVGAPNMMPALNEGVLGMKPGGKRLLVTPPALAYGSQGLPGVIPPDTSLILILELVSAAPAN